MERINSSRARSFGSGWVQPTLLVVWRFGRAGRRTRERRSPGIDWDCWWLRCWQVRSKTPWNGLLAFSVVEKEKRGICVCRPAQVRACGPWWGDATDQGSCSTEVFFSPRPWAKWSAWAWHGGGGQLLPLDVLGTKIEMVCTFLFWGQRFYNLCRLSPPGLYALLGLHLLCDY